MSYPVFAPVDEASGPGVLSFMVIGKVRVKRREDYTVRLACGAGASPPLLARTANEENAPHSHCFRFALARTPRLLRIPPGCDGSNHPLLRRNRIAQRQQASRRS